MKNTTTRTFAALALSLGAFGAVAVLLACLDSPQAQSDVPIRAPIEDTSADAGGDAQAVERLDGDLHSEPSWSDDAHRLARLATNEDGLTARRAERDPRRIDIYLIAAVQLRRAASEATTVGDVIARYHTRHTRDGRRSGAWIPSLSTSLNRPTSWPETAIPWDTSWRGRAAWEARLNEALEILASDNSGLDCPAAFPVSWGGPFVDLAVLVARLESGRFRIVAGPTIQGERPEWRVPEEQCSVGERARTSNVFLARARDLDRGHR